MKEIVKKIMSGAEVSVEMGSSDENEMSRVRNALREISRAIYCNIYTLPDNSLRLTIDIPPLEEKNRSNVVNVLTNTTLNIQQHNA